MSYEKILPLYLEISTLHYINRRLIFKSVNPEISERLKLESKLLESRIEIIEKKWPGVKKYGIMLWNLTGVYGPNHMLDIIKKQSENIDSEISRLDARARGVRMLIKDEKGIKNF